MEMAKISRTVLKLFIPLVLFFCPSLSTTKLPSQIAVVYNGAKLTKRLSSNLLQNSFERIPSLISKTSKPSVRFVYFDLNCSRICNYRKFLSLFPDGIRQFSLFVLIESCSCEKKLSVFVQLFGVKFISSCEEPVLTAAGSSAILLHTERNRRHFLVAPQNAHGLDFHKKLSCHLSLKKIKIARTFWLCKEEDLRDAQLKEVLHGINYNLTHNNTNGASFIIAFKEIDHVLVKMVLNIARMELNESFEKILWIFPQVNSHLEISSLFSTKENAQVLTFKGICTENTSVKGFCSEEAVHTIVTKTIDFMRRKWNMNKEKYSELPKVDVSENCTLNNAELDKYNRNSFHVLQLQKHDLFEEINWKRISTWNGQTLQPCCNEMLSQATLGFLPHESRPVIRVPLVEYKPFVVKHKFNEHIGNCPHDMRVCYGLKRQAINNTVINRDDRYCCSGLTIDVITYLDNHMSSKSEESHEFELYFQEEQLYGVYNKENGTWNGIFADILSGKGDVGIDLSLTPQRCLVLDCSLGYFMSGFNTIATVSKINIEKKDSSLAGNFELFLSPFHYRLFITVLMFFNFFLLLIWGTDKICLYYRNKRTGRNDKFTLLESISYVWAIAFSRDVGDSKKPMTLTARYLASWLSFLAVIFTNVYVARLMVELVKEQSAVPTFRSLKDSKVLDNEFKVGVITGTAIQAFFHNTRDSVLKQSYENNMKKHLMPTMEVGVQAVKNGTLHGLIGDSMSLLTILHYDQNCSLALIGKEFSTLPIGFVFRKDWPWVKEFKFVELEMNELNVSSEVFRRHFSDFSCLSSDVYQSGLAIADISGLFMILVFGIVYCALSLVMENVFSLLSYWYKYSSKKWNVHGHGHGDAPRDDVLETNKGMS